MRIDFATLAFGYSVKVGGSTPNWATALGQSKEHKINDNTEIDEILKGMTYSSVSLEKITTKLGKGGNVVRGNIDDSPIVLASVFHKVYINDILITGGKYILLITRDTSKSHAGRLRVKYGPSNTYENGGDIYSNQTFIQEMKKQLSLSDDACWFVSDISIRNQDELILKTTIVNPNGSEEYEDKESLRAAWENMDSTLISTDIDTDINIERNRIIFGAPGTGKSHKLEEDSKMFGENMERVTFHPNYSYSSFVGTYKPVMEENELDLLIDDEKKKVITILQDKSMSAQEKYNLLYDKFKSEGLTRLPILLGIYTDEGFKTKKVDGTDTDNSVERNHGRAIRPYLNLQSKYVAKEISYEYVPGPFMRIYTQAINHPEENFLLLIEEINRANVAAVFGDIFQLLDRKNGVSEYPIAASEDIKKFMLNNLECLKGKCISELSDEEKEMYLEMRIPNNMYIWATMNSADQGVFPMDTAFKRRWEFEYIGIDAERDMVKDYVIPVGMGKSRHYIHWNELREGINDILSKEENRVNEDKLLGPFFISKPVLDNISNALGDTKAEDAFVKSFESKVIMYLFEDVMKMRPEKIFIGCKDKKLFSKICEAFETDGEKIFGLNDIECVSISKDIDDIDE